MTTQQKWRRPKQRTWQGLGDVVHAVARPIAGIIDTLAGTHLKNCRGCAARRGAWNQKFPLGGPQVDSRSRE